MLQTTWIAMILGIWSSMYLVDAFLKSRPATSQRYYHFLEKTGLSVLICQVRWYTSAFNRCFLRAGQWRPHFLCWWFSCGVFISLLLMILSVCLLTLLVLNTIQQKSVEQQVLTPVMPGINLPPSQVWYYMLTLMFCGVLHEVGHAIAAVSEQVRVNGFGIFVLLIYPGAFVDLSTEHLLAASPIQQLRIYCAGVWHNFVIVVVALFLLFSLPVLLLPFYSSGAAVTITHIVSNSAVSGSRGLTVGDSLTGVGDCSVRNAADWYNCIMDSMNGASLGHCLPVGLINELSTVSQNQSQRLMDDLDCCRRASHTHLCFVFHTRDNQKMRNACLPARTTTDRPVCKLQSDCYLPGVDSSCVYPDVDNETKLLRVFHGRRPPMLFLGHPLDLYYSVSVSDYTPANYFVPISLPYVIETLCKYLISLSGALVILNIVPCYALDGQHICYAVIELCLRSSVTSKPARNVIYLFTVAVGSVLLGLNVLLAIWTLFS